MIGKICKSLTPFYDMKAHKNNFKVRPVLIIGNSDSTDYIAIPISRVSKKGHIHPVYDISVTMTQYPNLKLDYDSYIRTHKQTVINRANLSGVISDLKTEYEDLFLEILVKREEFNNQITETAIS